MKALKSGFIAVVVIILVLLFSVFFKVQEGEEALVLHLGNIKVDSVGAPVIYMPGLHVKIPFVDTVRKFDTRLQTLAVESSRVLTAEQKYLLVDYYAKWHISDLSQYYKSTGGVALRADQLLAQKINDGMRAEFGQRTITEVVSGERENIMMMLKHHADDVSKGLGIDVVDVRINRIDLPKNVSHSVFARMRAQREQVAAKHRADGKSAAEAIRANADAEVTVILATAKAAAAHTRAVGDAEAAAIYNKSYGADAPFYVFYRSMQAYEKIFSSKRDVVVLSMDDPFMKYMKGDDVDKAS